jgi:hypothetical protein
MKSYFQRKDFILTSIARGSCASPTVVQTIKPGDSGLSCPQLQNEYADTREFKVNNLSLFIDTSK